jgi:hypothetical protein
MAEDINHEMRGQKMKAKSLLTIILLFLLFLIAVLSNPTEKQYISWLKEDHKASSQQPPESEIEVFAPALSGTETTNYFLFSIYQTELEDGSKQKTLGLLNNFFAIN